LTVIKTRDIERALLSKGFQRVDSDHKYYFFYVNGKKTLVRTKISHGTDEYGDHLLGLIKDQLHLGKRELEEFVECSLSGEKYKELLIERKIVVYP
jgi:hypothetical protein